MITINQAKTYLQFSNSDYDSLISDIIEYSISFIENYVGYKLSKTTETNYFQGTGRQMLSLSKNNITEVAEVKIDDVVLSNTLYSIRNNMLFKKDLWEKSYVSISDIREIAYNIEVRYTYGYTYPLITDSVNNGTVPKELQFVALEIMRKTFINCGTQQQISSERGSQKNASFGVNYFELKFKDDLSKDLKRILDKYKR